MKKSGLLYDHNIEKSSCGVGFITKKNSKQTHDLLIKAHEALCSVPHRGGMSSEGIGDGAGISIDLSVDFFSKITNKTLKYGKFVVGNFFIPKNKVNKIIAEDLIIKTLGNSEFKLIKSRDVPVNKSVLNEISQSSQLTIKQFIFSIQNINDKDIDKSIHQCLLDIEAIAFKDKKLDELYPLSLSRKLQVLKGRLKSNEIIPYFKDLNDKSHKIFSLYFHTRFSTNTEPHPFMAQPFRLIAHNGELNTNKKNILSENAAYKSKNKNIIRPKGQSDSCRLIKPYKIEFLKMD
jgi:glutamate synthase (NADPH/NADH) large chain